MRTFFGTHVSGPRLSTGLLLIRLVFGLAFFLHGIPKIQNPTGWMGPALPGAVQAVAACAEVFGGLGVLLGLLTPLAAILMAAQMVVALGMVHLPHGHPFVDASGKGPSYEAAAHFLAVGLGLLATGPGAYSLDALLFGHRERSLNSPGVIPRTIL